MRDGAGINLIMDELRDLLQGLVALCAGQRPSSCSHLIKLGETAGREGTSTGEMTAE